jgi:inorganic phosphate transporter, PiT family
MVLDVGYALLLSPVIGFVASAIPPLAPKFFVRRKELFQEPKKSAPPPWLYWLFTKLF